MKNILSILVLSSLLLTPVKKSEAGVVVGLITAAKSDSGTLGIAFGLGTASVIAIVAGPFLILPRANFPVAASIGNWMLLSAFVLDADGSDQIAVLLSEKYPFLNNQEVSNDLAAKIKKGLAEKQNEPLPVLISLSEAEVESSLEPIKEELTKEQIKKIVDDLK